MASHTKILIIGGGFYGLYLADYFARQKYSVRLVEKEAEFMTRASRVNQARAHHGYHYPRGILTALRSKISFPRFVKEFSECIESDFEKFYLVGRPLGKITARQFETFCARIGAPCERASGKIRSLINPLHVEECFSVVEYAFDSSRLRDTMVRRLAQTDAVCDVYTSAKSVTPSNNGLVVQLCNERTQELEAVYADHVFNCTYSQINSINSASGLEIVPLKHELTELCLVDVPDALKKIGITVMCGPFFSLMPFPSTGTHSFSHVRYTPHCTWQESAAHPTPRNVPYASSTTHSAWTYMRKDASRYIPILSECNYRQSLWEVKTVLPRSESDDSRPILFLPHYGMKGFHCTMGGKIDNVYEVIQAIQSHNLVGGAYT